NATATGPGGVNDYSTWQFTYTEDYQLIQEGVNELTSKLSCLSNPANVARYYSVNVIGVVANNQTLQPIQTANDTITAANNQTLQPIQTANKTAPLLYPMPSVTDNQSKTMTKTITISETGIANTNPITMTIADANTCNKNLIISDIISFGDDDEGHDAIETNVLDNNLNTRWSTETVGSWIQTDLGVNNVICSLDIAWYKGNTRSYNFIISLSTDGTTYTNVYEGISSGKTLSSERYNFKENTARYVKITINGNNEDGNENWGAITEIDVNGSTETDKKVSSPNTVTLSIRGTYEHNSSYFPLSHEEVELDPSKLEGSIAIYNSSTNEMIEEYDLAPIDVRVTDLFKTLSITTSLDHPIITGSVNATLRFMSPIDFQNGGNYSSNTTTTNDGNLLIAKVDNKIYDTKRTAIGRIVIDPSG
ncbi:MAG TPA: discoidin domain-containing protein, partial [Nitrososphaeraceae archaeon]|nr:discoidin domain-containing protein [Nitrososphaeraceae archaeon]